MNRSKILPRPTFGTQSKNSDRVSRCLLEEPSSPPGLSNRLNTRTPSTSKRKQLAIVQGGETRSGDMKPLPERDLVLSLSMRSMKGGASNEILVQEKKKSAI